MNWFKGLVSDGEHPSTMRVMLLIVVLTWSVISIRQNALYVPDMNVVKFLATIFGAKAGQSAIENFASRSPAAPKTETTAQCIQ
jgi:hypothetical protein